MCRIQWASCASVPRISPPRRIHCDETRSLSMASTSRLLLGTLSAAAPPPNVPHIVNKSIVGMNAHTSRTTSGSTRLRSSSPFSSLQHTPSLRSLWRSHFAGSGASASVGAALATAQIGGWLPFASDVLVVSLPLRGSGTEGAEVDMAVRGRKEIERLERCELTSSEIQEIIKLRRSRRSYA